MANNKLLQMFVAKSWEKQKTEKTKEQATKKFFPHSFPSALFYFVCWLFRCRLKFIWRLNPSCRQENDTETELSRRNAFKPNCEPGSKLGGRLLSLAWPKGGGSRWWLGAGLGIIYAIIFPKRNIFLNGF